MSGTSSEPQIRVYRAFSLEKIGLIYEQERMGMDESFKCAVCDKEMAILGSCPVISCG